LICATLTGTLCCTAAAGIPEPDYILHGQVCIGGAPASAGDDVTVIAKAIVQSQLREVGRYKMGDSDAATDCNGDADCYILRIRLESVPVGESPSGTAAILNRATPSSAYVFLMQGTGPEQFVAEIRIADSAVIRRLDLRDAAATADLNGDGRKDLLDHKVLVASLQGPGVSAPGTCNAADLNGDGHVDLRDFALFQAAFTGSGK